MEKFIGKTVKIFLKNGKGIVGVLDDFDKENVYLIKNNNLLIVEKNNINYYCINDYFSSKKENRIIENVVSVYVDKKFVSTVSVGDIGIDKWDNRIMSAVLADNVLHDALSNRVQKSVEYSPGNVYINTVSENNEVKDNCVLKEDPILSTYLNPSEMISRLNNICIKNEHR